MKLTVLLALVFLCGCAAQQSSDIAENAEAVDTEEVEAPRSKRIYYFQHRVIPNWLFGSNGAFYDDLNTGNFERILEAAHDIIDAQYAVLLEISPVAYKDAILFTFPSPTSPPNCFFALIEKTESGFNYFTYESTWSFSDDLDDVIVGVAAGWDAEGNHLNFGPRSYKTSAEFVADMLSD